jgi:hypothetical protein
MSNYTAPSEFFSRTLFFSSLNTPKSVRHNFISRQNFSNLFFSWREFCRNGIARQQQPLRDLDQVRAFLSGAGPTAFLDMPWIAARVAGAHEMILRLPDGYGTRLGERGTALSAGQRQRIGLARAVFGRPFLVLDEPNANLDADGENVLVNAIEILRNEQSIVIVISHRPQCFGGAEHGHGHLWRPGDRFRTARGCICARRAPRRCELGQSSFARRCGGCAMNP